MASSSLGESRTRVADLEVRKPEPAKAGLRKSDTSQQLSSALRNSDDDTNAVRTADEAQQLAAHLLDEALNDPRCQMSSDEVAYLLGVSRSLVDKWREPDAPNSPSLIQLLRLPLKFHLALNRAMDRRFGYGRAALADVLSAIGALAVSLGR